MFNFKNTIFKNMKIHVKLNHRAVITAIWDIGKH